MFGLSLLALRLMLNFINIYIYIYIFFFFFFFFWGGGGVYSVFFVWLLKAYGLWVWGFDGSIGV